MKRTTLTLVLAATLTLVACGSDDEAPAPAPQTVTETAEPYVEPEPVEEDISGLALQMTWDAMTATEQEDICFGWRADPDMMYGFFTDGAGEDTFSEAEVRAFFDGKCL